MPWSKLAMLALFAEWWIPFTILMFAAFRQQRKIALVDHWKRHAAKSGANRWIFYDGIGN